jgi:hypothetical protein
MIPENLAADSRPPNRTGSMRTSPASASIAGQFGPADLALCLEALVHPGYSSESFQMGDTQVIEFLNARQALKTAEEQLEEIRLRAERLAKSLEDWQSIRPDGELRSGWPDAQAVNDALRACHEAQQKFSQAEASLRPADRKLLELDREEDF